MHIEFLWTALEQAEYSAEIEGVTNQ